MKLPRTLSADGTQVGLNAPAIDHVLQLSDRPTRLEFESALHPEESPSVVSLDPADGKRRGLGTTVRSTWQPVEQQKERSPMAKRNLTIQLEDEIIRRVKVPAAMRDTSVSSLIAQELERLVEADERYEAAEK